MAQPPGAARPLFRQVAKSPSRQSWRVRERTGRRAPSDWRIWRPGDLAPGGGARRTRRVSL